MSRRLPGNTAPTLFGLPRSAVAGTIVAFTLAGCGSPQRGSAEVDSSSQAAPSTAPSRTPLETTKNPSQEEVPTITFDYLNGNSKVIQVYPGPSDKPADKVYNGTYMDRDVRPVDCEIENGRAVHSVDPETPKTSSTTWFKLAGGAPGAPEQWATDVYANPTNPAIPIQACPQ